MLNLVISQQTKNRTIEPDSQLYIEHSYINIKCICIIRFYRFFKNVTNKMIFFSACLTSIFSNQLFMGKLLIIKVRQKKKKKKNISKTLQSLPFVMLNTS